MRKNLALVLSALALASLTACESHSTSTTNVQITTDVDGETTEYSYNSEVTDGNATVESTVVTQSESAENKYDSDIYDMKYLINDEGNLVLYVIETDNDYGRIITPNGIYTTMEFVADEIDENNNYYVELKPTITDGPGQAIMGHFTLESGEEAVDFGIIDVSIEGGKVTEVTNAGFTDDLDNALN